MKRTKKIIFKTTCTKKGLKCKLYRLKSLFLNYKIKKNKNHEIIEIK